MSTYRHAHRHNSGGTVVFVDCRATSRNQLRPAMRATVGTAMMLTTLLALAFLSDTTLAGKIEFLVSELPGTVDPHGDSYVVAVDKSETEFIEHARDLADWVEAGGDPAESPGATILVANIAPGADGINRDYLAPGEPPWSWHVVGTPSFADFTIEILDGWPTFVEQDVDGWIENTGGQIGFWGYTVTRELGPVVPEPASFLLFACGGATLFIYLRTRRIA